MLSSDEVIGMSQLVVHFLQVLVIGGFVMRAADPDLERLPNSRVLAWLQSQLISLCDGALPSVSCSLKTGIPMKLKRRVGEWILPHSSLSLKHQ